MDFTLDYMEITLDYTESHASDWSEAQSAQSREVALRGILIRDVCLLSWGEFWLGDILTVNQGTLSDLLALLLQYILEFTAIVVLF